MYVARFVMAALHLTAEAAWAQGIIVYRGAYFGFYDTGKGVIFGDKEAESSFLARWAVAQVTSTTPSHPLTSFPV